MNFAAVVRHSQSDNRRAGQKIDEIKKISRCRTCRQWRHWHFGHNPNGASKSAVQSSRAPLPSDGPEKKSGTLNTVNMTDNSKFSFSHFIGLLLHFEAPYSGLEMHKLKSLSAYLRKIRTLE